MLISNTRNFIFIHIPKTGGISVRNALSPIHRIPLERISLYLLKHQVKSLTGRDFSVFDKGLTHARALDIQAAMSQEIFSSFYKFAFVRNPWDWNVSWYHFLLKEKKHPAHGYVIKMRDFDEYLEKRITTKSYNLQKDFIMNSQGELLVDFVGRYETLASDFNSVCKALKISVPLHHYNSSKHPPYRTLYNSYTRKLVADHFAGDIEIFQYSF
jgi:hypothetical protein